MSSKLMIAALALSAASFTFAEQKPKITPPSTTAPAPTQTDGHAKKSKGKKHKEHQPEQKPPTN